eukprot:Seg4313.1 transcript_id=Seg4313.1/GoldUCD/mRNA.D3Y31 product="Zinc finger protein 768" protein_id=Seg4313.1/GoldUCD/D3Y31
MSGNLRNEEFDPDCTVSDLNTSGLEPIVDSPGDQGGYYRLNPNGRHLQQSLQQPQSFDKQLITLNNQSSQDSQYFSINQYRACNPLSYQQLPSYGRLQGTQFPTLEAQSNNRQQHEYFQQNQFQQTTNFPYPSSEQAHGRKSWTDFVHASVPPPSGSEAQSTHTMTPAIMRRKATRRRKTNVPVSMGDTNNSIPQEDPTATTVVTDETNLKCDACGKEFTRRDTLKRHSFTHTREKMDHRCTVCKKHFRGKWELKRHSDHVHENKYGCDICTIDFHSQVALANHKVSDHSPNSEMIKRTCPICERIFSNNYAYEGHLRKHKKDDSSIPVPDIKCKECGKKFTYQQSLTRHEQACSTKNRQKPFRCPHVPCEKRYTDKKGLTVHVNTVHKRKCHGCRCGKSFSYHSGLWNHQRSCKMPIMDVTTTENEFGEKIPDEHEEVLAINTIPRETVTAVEVDEQLEEAAIIAETQPDEQGKTSR